MSVELDEMRVSFYIIEIEIYYFYIIDARK